MTTTVNGNRPDVTVRDELHGCVRAPENPVQASDPAAERPGTARTGVSHVRAISQDMIEAQRKRATDSMSLHVTEARRSGAKAWPLTEPRPALAEVWRTVAPAKGGSPNWFAWLFMTAAGLFRAGTHTLTYLIDQATATRLRAGVGLALLLLVVAVVSVAHTVASAQLR